MFNVENAAEFSALLTSLKSSVISSSLIFLEMLKDNKQEIEIDEDDAKQIVALLMYDSLVRKSTGYSYLDDFDFSQSGKVLLKNKDKDRVKSNVETMLEYLLYRIEVPVDIASC